MACFVRPDYEVLTHWVSSYLKLAVESAQSLGLQVFDLYGSQATAESFFNVLSQFNPYIVCSSTHGLENVVYGQDGTPLLTGCVNDQALSGKVYFALACRTASALGPSSISKGGLIYWGWLEDFIVIMDESYPPLQDPYAYSFLHPILDGLDVLFRSILAGVDVQTLARNVYEAVVKSFNDEIAYWRTAPTATASQMLTYLIHDRDTFVPITAAGIYTPPAMVTAQFPLQAFLAVGAATLPLALKGLMK